MLNERKLTTHAKSVDTYQPAHSAKPDVNKTFFAIGKFVNW